MSRRTVRVVSFALALVGAPIAVVAQAAPPVANTSFDYYVMTLSWAPGFCDLGGKDTSSPECAAGSGDGFVVHGLWPDNDYRPNPEGCQGQDASPADLADEHGLYPNDSLAAYEYRKHGTCTGLSRARLFRHRAQRAPTDRHSPDAAGPAPAVASFPERHRAGLHGLERQFAS